MFSSGRAASVSSMSDDDDADLLRRNSFALASSLHAGSTQMATKVVPGTLVPATKAATLHEDPLDDPMRKALLSGQALSGFTTLCASSPSQPRLALAGPLPAEWVVD